MNEINKYCAVQWFPGHMTKTNRIIAEKIKLVDIVIEIIDARIPKSSRNPDLDKWSSNKAKILILNKADMADNKKTKEWLGYYEDLGNRCLIIDCKTGKGIKAFIPLVKDVLKNKILSNKNKGMVSSRLSMMIVGVPNVGKSSFINKISSHKATKVEDRPGVTRGLQWVKIDKDIDMVDVPGTLWPKFEDPRVGERLAFTGAVKDQVIDIQMLATRLIENLILEYKQNIINRYNLSNIDGLKSFEILELIAKKRGMLIGKGELDIERASIMILDEYRGGKLGNITLENVSFK